MKTLQQGFCELFTPLFVSVMLHDVTATYTSLVPPRSSLRYLLLVIACFLACFQCANMEGESLEDRATGH